MANSAKAMIDRLIKMKEESGKANKINVTLRIDKTVYEKARKQFKAKKVMISEVVEQFLREATEKE